MPLEAFGGILRDLLVSILRRPIVPVAILLFACSPVGAFLITVHGSLTADALAAFPDTQISGFEKEQILLGCKKTDITEGGLPFTESHYDKRFHFDGRTSYPEILANYVELIKLLDYNIGRKRRDPYEFGKILHAAEDFQAHSNYIILYRDYRKGHGDPMVGQIPSFEEVLAAPDKFPGFLQLLDAKLHTGIYPNDANFHSFAENYHGSFVGTGMNKDSIVRAHFGEARETALVTAMWYLRLYVGDPDAKWEYAAFKATLAKERGRTEHSSFPQRANEPAIAPAAPFRNSASEVSPAKSLVTTFQSAPYRASRDRHLSSRPRQPRVENRKKVAA